MTSVRADPIAKRNIFPNAHLRIEPSANCYRFATVAKRRYRTSMKISCLVFAIFFAAAVSLLGNDQLTERLQPALEAITPDSLLAHIKVLASDEFEGRAPGSKGEDL